ncbi:MAG TPA: nuclear transport factor 2 family protein [Thermoleophilaceae bacterium]|nr:nuclear transport factor 2 family protein [Thermoleophilaceae bacterium]
MADFVERFARWWSDPDPDRLGELLAEDVRLVQPLAPDTTTLADAAASFRRLFRFLPDLRGEIHDSATDGNVVFIHFTLSATYGGKPISWDAVDRFVLRDDGLAVERVSFFDSQPLAVQMLTRPRGWTQLVHSGFRPQLRARPPGRASAPGAPRSSGSASPTGA